MTWKPATFKMSDAQIYSFKRWVVKPMDCVINALELIGALDGSNADLMRIAAGDNGLQKDQIENIFRYLFPSNKWDFFGYSDIKKLEEFAINYMEPGRVVFCGYYGHNTSVNSEIGHVFLIGKDKYGQILYMDPQIGGNWICNLIGNPECYDYLKDKNQYFILQHSGPTTGLAGGGRKRKSPTRGTRGTRGRRRSRRRGRRKSPLATVHRRRRSRSRRRARPCVCV
jgi:hypothetical protein